MKFIHTADLHLGANPDAGKRYSEERGQEIWETFSRLITECDRQEADLLLIAGDLFHRQPLLRELKEVNYLFSKLVKTKVVLIAGNHDYLKWDSYYRTFHWNTNVFPLLGDKLQCADFPEISTCVYGFSYHQREITENRYDKAKPWGKETCEILLAHGGDEKHIPINKKELLSLGYDYIALGHIHKPGIVEKNKANYAGAPEPVDKNDTGAHGYILGEMKEGRLTTEFIPFASREYVHMDVHVNADMTNTRMREVVFEELQKRGMQNIYKVILKGFRNPDIIFTFSNLDEYGNILEVIDKTKPAYQFDKLREENRDNLLGNYIDSLVDFPRDSVEYMALYEGVEALLETKKG